MARDATARLYDVDDDSVVYKKPNKRGKYDHGTVAFRAKKGKLVDLDKLLESIWATRLSGGTRSGLVSLDVTAVGVAAVTESGIVLKVSDTDQHFQLVENTRQKDGLSPYQLIRLSIDRGETRIRMTGRLQGWSGRWPDFLAKRPPKPWRIIVSRFQVEQR